MEALDQRDRYREYGLTIPNGMLLFGPPGCGKSFIAEKFSEQVGCNVIKVTRSDVASIYVDGAVTKVRELFDAAKKAAPSILFFDEFESLVPDRRQDIHQAYKSTVNEFLTQLQGLSEDSVFVLATTNSPNLIDPAIMRTGRIDKVIYVPPPDTEARKEMFRLHLQSRPSEIGIDKDRLAELTENFVSSDIKLIVDEAARAALEKRERISMATLENIIGSQRPSISVELLGEYQSLNDSYSEHGRGGAMDEPKRIRGFRKP